MPSREAFVYSDINIAEYFRDIGMHLSLMAECAPRWAEALREISGRFAEVPEDSGYPSDLLARLVSFYERAGIVNCIVGPNRVGNITIIGTVLPSGDEFSNPIAVASMTFVKVFGPGQESISVQAFSICKLAGLTPQVTENV